MTFEVPKIFGNEYGFFSKNAQSAGVSATPVSFGGVNKGGISGSLRKDLDEIASYGQQKSDTSFTSGLCGAPTADYGCGNHLWTYC